MNNGMKSLFLAGLSLALCQPALRAQEKTAKPVPEAATQFSSEKEKISYAVGMTFGLQLKSSKFEVDPEIVIQALKDSLAGKELKMTEQQRGEVLRAYQQQMRAKMEEQRKVTLEKNKKDAAAFFEANKSKPGVNVLVVTNRGQTAEMQYKVISEGNGPVPTANDIVTVSYRGTLIDGKEFDSTAKHGGQPLKTPVGRGIIPGWTEALEHMKVGSKWEIFVPSDLAYGDYGRPPEIEPGAPLIFEMELLSAEPAPPPAQPQPPHQQPLTSDIIRVPSKAELDKGAKIEVMTPEEAERRAKAETNKPAGKQ